MFGCERPAAFFASRRNRSMNESSAAWRSSRTESIRVSPVTAMALLLRPRVEDRLHQDLGDRRRCRAAEPGLVLERDCDGDLRGVGRSEADEPGRVDPRVACLSGAGL